MGDDGNKNKQRPTDIVALDLARPVKGPRGNLLNDGPPPPDADMRTAEPGKGGWKALDYGGMLTMLIMSVKGDSPAQRARQFRLAMRVGGDREKDAPLRLPAKKVRELLEYIQKLPNDHELAIPIYQGSAVVFLEDALGAGDKG